MKLITPQCRNQTSAGKVTGVHANPSALCSEAAWPASYPRLGAAGCPVLKDDRWGPIAAWLCRLAHWPVQCSSGETGITPDMLRTRVTELLLKARVGSGVGCQGRSRYCSPLEALPRPKKFLCSSWAAPVVLDSWPWASACEMCAQTAELPPLPQDHFPCFLQGGCDSQLLFLAHCSGSDPWQCAGGHMQCWGFEAGSAGAHLSGHPNKIFHIITGQIR